MDVIIPTHNRRDIVVAKVAWLLALPTVERVILTADACTDGTAAALRDLDVSRVVVTTTTQAVGPHGGRNRAIALATTDWLVIVDDDDGHPDDFIECLAQAAREAQADIVGAPWINLQGDELLAEVDRRRSHPEPPELDAFGRFPPRRWVETPWLPPAVLARRSVFSELSYDEGYGGNYWREETDLFVSASRAGYRVVLTGLTYSSGGPRGSGGIARRSRLRYELDAFANNRRFLAKHGRWLKASGHLGGTTHAQAVFVWTRTRYRVGGATRERLRRLRLRFARSTR